MRILRHRAAYVAAAFMILVSIIAILISVRVTITAVDRQDQEVRKPEPAATDTVSASAKVIAAGKINGQKLYFNGTEEKEIDCFLWDKREVLVSMNDVLRCIGAEYRLYAPDDLLETRINEKQLTLRLGRDSFFYDGKEIKLPYAPFTFKGNILVPLALFSVVAGFSQQQTF